MIYRLTLALLIASLAATCSAEVHPADILDLETWKLTLPYDTQRPGDPDEVLMPELARFADASCFFATESGDAVIFRASCDGEQTENSKYPRSELREMDFSGEDEASWSVEGGDIHSLELELAITQLPKRKQHVVCMQIHDDLDDLLMVRLEDHKLFIERSNAKDVRLDSAYKLGERFTLRLVASEGRIKAWYNGKPKMDWKVNNRGCYFKAGCYTQSNYKIEQQEGSYGEVVVYRLELLHSD